MARVLIAEDEYIAIRILQEELRHAGYEVVSAKDGREASLLLQKYSFDVILLDIQLPYKNGFELLREARLRSKESIVILITAFASIDSAVKAIKLGADDYITKPYDISELLEKISQNIEIKIKRKHLYSPDDGRDGVLYGDNILIRHIKDTIQKIKDINTTVLITGESGTGKGIIAKEIHGESLRKTAPFMLVDCAALPPNLIESELFGYEKGAFTSAVSARRGKFELAEKGTVFLDEIGILTPNLQSKLLTVLQEKCYYRVGGTKKIPMEARIIAATNENLEKRVENGEFREDLYYRLNVVRIETPPLRMRKDDIPGLAAIFLNRFTESMGKDIGSIEDQFVETLIKYDWPGNVRELENALESAIALCDENILRVSDLPLKITKNKGTSDKELITGGNLSSIPLKKQEMLAIVSALEKFGGHRERTAQYLGISRRTLQYKLKKYNLLDYGHMHKIG